MILNLFSSNFFFQHNTISFINLFKKKMFIRQLRQKENCFDSQANKNNVVTQHTELSTTICKQYDVYCAGI